MTADPFTLALCLARPVTRGLLSVDDADGALAVAVAHQARRADASARVDMPGRLHLASAILRQMMDRMEAERDRVQSAIVRGTWSLIDELVAQKITRGRVRAEAHDINASQGLAFTEQEVEAILVGRVRAAVAKRDGLPATRPLRRRHG